MFYFTIDIKIKYSTTRISLEQNLKKLMTSVNMFSKFKSVSLKLCNFVWLSVLNYNKLRCWQSSVILASN